MATDASLPPSDRTDQADAVAQPREHVAAIVLKTPRGYFRRFRSRGGIIETRLAGHARIFPPGTKSLTETLARLKRRGIVAVAEKVELVIIAS